jgi:hypothetical protein
MYEQAPGRLTSVAVGMANRFSALTKLTLHYIFCCERQPISVGARI